MTVYTIEHLIEAIEQLPSDPPIEDSTVWYTTQKEHWLGWLREYHGPGGYGRKTGVVRDARYAYNHIVNYQMLLYLIEAASFSDDIVDAAYEVAEEHATLQAASAAVRRVVPWPDMAQALWGNNPPKS